MPLPKPLNFEPLDDSEVFQVMYGHPAGKEPLELLTTKAIAKELLNDAYKLARPFVRQVAIEGHKAGLPLETIQYLFWVILDSPKTWPVLSDKPKQALLMAKNLTESSGELPGYHRGLVVPDRELEAVVDHCIEKIASWCLTTLVPTLKQDWVKIVARNSQTLDVQAMWLDNRFQEELFKRPNTFPENVLLFRIIRLIHHV